MYRDETIKRLAENLDELRKTYQVEQFSLFGSVARNEATDSSDIDLLVEFSRTPGLLKFIALQQHLEQLLGTQVDLVTRKALKLQIKETILSEAIQVS